MSQTTKNYDKYTRKGDKKVPEQIVKRLSTDRRYFRECPAGRSIPPKRNRKEQCEYDKYLYKQSHLVENCFHVLKRWRGMAIYSLEFSKEYFESSVLLKQFGYIAF